MLNVTCIESDNNLITIFNKDHIEFRYNSELADYVLSIVNNLKGSFTVDLHKMRVACGMDYPIYGSFIKMKNTYKTQGGFGYLDKKYAKFNFTDGIDHINKNGVVWKKSLKVNLIVKTNASIEYRPVEVIPMPEIAPPETNKTPELEFIYRDSNGQMNVAFATTHAIQQFELRYSIAIGKCKFSSTEGMIRSMKMIFNRSFIYEDRMTDMRRKKYGDNSLYLKYNGTIGKDSEIGFVVNPTNHTIITFELAGKKTRKLNKRITVSKAGRL